MPWYLPDPNIRIFAEQWWPPGDERHVKMIPGVQSELIGPIMDADGAPPPDKIRYYIDTLEGKMYVSPGDYIVTGIKGEKYPCKPDIFEQKYILGNV
jgi:hypothetical protein